MSGRATALERARGLKAALLAAGVPEVSIEIQEGRPTSGDEWNACRPACDFSHHTASYWRAGSHTPVLALVKRGRSDVPGPLANGYGGWDLCYRVITCGLANHPGRGGPLTVNGRVIPRDSARPHTWGTEYEGGYLDSDWDRVHTNPRNGKRMTFREFMGRANHGIQTFFGLPEAAHLEHSTWAPGRKVDRLHYTRASGIAEIRRHSSRPTRPAPAPAPTKPPEEDPMFLAGVTTDDRRFLVAGPFKTHIANMDHFNALLACGIPWRGRVAPVALNYFPDLPSFFRLLGEIRGLSADEPTLAEIRALLKELQPPAPAS